LYELAEKYPKRKVLEYAVERCKETVGLEALKEQAQKAGTETASSNLEIFDDKLKHALTDMFKSDDLDASLGRFTDLACHNEHAFVYVLSLLEAVAKRRRLSDGSAVGAGGGGGGIEGDINEERVATGGDSAEEDVSRLCEEVRQEAVKRGKGKQAEALYNGMTGANQYPEAAVLSLLALLAQKKSTNTDAGGAATARSDCYGLQQQDERIRHQQTLRALHSATSREFAAPPVDSAAPHATANSGGGGV
jgi:hypothetical protein